MESVMIFDTTLRDGEQSPGATMTTEEKIKIALGLERLGVDVIEAGFAASSPGDFEAIAQIATLVQKSTICSLARAVPSDVEAAAKALQNARKKRIHVFIATSPIHMEYKLKLTPDKVIAKAIETVRLAKSFTDDVEFSCEDACRSEMPFLKEILSAVVEVGATTLNLPDTVGYRFPSEIGAMIAELAAFIGNRATLSVHCHNDLGQATANSVAGILNGARQVECTINGLGERAGNTALEEVVMILKTRKDLFGNLTTNINTQEIYGISKLVADITGIRPQPNKAIVGKNAFAHESGIHQDGMLKNPETYEIMRPSDIGIPENNGLVLGKHSGRAAFKDKILALGYKNISEEEFQNAFARFKELCDSKKEIFDDDIRAILGEETTRIPQIFTLECLQVSVCSNGHHCSAVSLNKNGEILSDSALGNGAVDSILKTIDRVSGQCGKLKDYKVEAVSSGKDALAKVVVKVQFEPSKPAIIGHGVDIDTMTATAKAYISALNNYFSMKDLIGNKKENMCL